MYKHFEGKKGRELSGENCVFTTFTLWELERKAGAAGRDVALTYFLPLLLSSFLSSRTDPIQSQSTHYLHLYIHMCG
jgi:hypothetical protein